MTNIKVLRRIGIFVVIFDAFYFAYQIYLKNFYLSTWFLLASILFLVFALIWTSE